MFRQWQHFRNRSKPHHYRMVAFLLSWRQIHNTGGTL
jgi:hypothetical protein